MVLDLPIFRIECGIALNVFKGYDDDGDELLKGGEMVVICHLYLRSRPAAGRDSRLPSISVSDGRFSSCQRRMRADRLQDPNWMISLHYNNLNGILVDEMVRV
jgi:hypothetical protein